MARALTAGFVYFALAFAAGFVLGTLRVLIVVPRFGDTTAVLLELPIMLALSWAACSVLVRKFDVPTGALARFAMGGLAFALLMAAELAISTLGFGRTLIEHLAVYRAIGAQLGLAAQCAFALLPWLQSRLGRHNGARF